MTDYHGHKGIENTCRGQGGIYALARLENAIFEGLPGAEAGRFSAAVVGSIRDGADLSLVETRMRLSMLADDEIGLRRVADPDSRACLDRAVDLTRRDLGGDKPTEKEWIDARDTACRVANAIAKAARADRAARNAEAGVKVVAENDRGDVAWTSVARVAYWTTSGATAVWYSVVDAATAAQGFAWGTVGEVAAQEVAWRRIAALFLAELAAAPMAIEAAP